MRCLPRATTIASGIFRADSNTDFSHGKAVCPCVSQQWAIVAIMGSLGRKLCENVRKVGYLFPSPRVFCVVFHCFRLICVVLYLKSELLTGSILSRCRHPFVSFAVFCLLFSALFVSRDIFSLVYQECVSILRPACSCYLIEARALRSELSFLGVGKGRKQETLSRT